MARINFSQTGSTPFQKLLGHNIQILKDWTSLEESLFNSNTFSSELKEEVRRTLAFNNGCAYCMAKGKPSQNHSDKKIELAIKLAHAFSNDEVNESLFNNLKIIFSDEEISELCALICFSTASQKFGARLNLQPNCLLEEI